MHRQLTRKTNILALTTAGVLATVGVGWAAIPGSDGTIKGCYATTNAALNHSKGDARIIDSGETCRSYEKPLSWNQQGPKGDRGLQGDRGLEGVPGKDGTNGLPGAPGQPGNDGAPGTNGQDGAPGTNGKDGAAGINGKDGAKGDKGDKGEPGAPGAGGTVLWAVVNEDGSLSRGSRAVSSSRPNPGNQGQYVVTFDRDVSRCAFIATLGSGGGEPLGSRPGEVRVSLQDFPEIDPTTLRVVTQASSGGQYASSSFAVVVTC